MTVKTGTMGTNSPEWAPLTANNTFSWTKGFPGFCSAEGAQHLAGSAPTEIWAEAGIDSEVLTCQLFGFGTENRVELMLPGRFPWVILTAVESPLLLLPDNQEEPAFFLIPCLPVKGASVLLPLQLPGQRQRPAQPCRGGVLPSRAGARAADPGIFYL